MIYEGFFKPPVDGKYRFYVSGAYGMSLYLSRSANTTNKTFLAEIATAQCVYDHYGSIRDANQISSFISLQKNSLYQIVLLRTSVLYTTNIWTAVEISAALTYPFASTYVAFYKISITYTPQPEIHLLKIYNWNSGTFKIVVQGYDPPGSRYILLFCFNF